MSTGSFENVTGRMCLEIIYLIYMHKEDLALNNQQELIGHKTNPNQIKLHLLSVKELLLITAR